MISPGRWRAETGIATLLGEKFAQDNVQDNVQTTASGQHVHPAWREFRDELSATVTRIIAYLGVLAVIAVTFLLIIMPPDSDLDETPSEPVFRSDWTKVERPLRAFALSMPEFAQPDPDYAIQRHASGGGRR